jgi:ABC-type transport system involved in cytochrome bd biosynthesis fused ATPase/permease subunit
MDSNSSESTLKPSGIDYNYSVDALKKAAFFNEIQLIQSHPHLIENSVDRNTILCYLKDRVDEITKKYK